MVVHAFRPDNLVSSAQKFVASVMGENFTHEAEQELDLAHVVEHEVKAGTPILLCSVPGYDASGRVDDLVALTNRPCTSIAIGKHVLCLERHFIMWPEKSFTISTASHFSSPGFFH